MSALSAHVTRSEIVTIRSGDGTSKSVYISASPLHSPDRRVTGAILILENVTAVRKIESDIEKRVIHLVSSGGDVEQLAID